jgi:chorismate mutase
MLEEIVENFPEEEILKADGLDEAVIGIDMSSMRLIYSKQECIRVMMYDQDMEQEEAIEYLEFNTFCAYVGEKTPIWCDDTI